jgi:biotin carboxyl carrier protein
MPGRVLKVLVEQNEVVRAGAPLVVVEAMKMENELVAGRDGTVTNIYVTAGETVEGGAKLIEIR